MANSRRFSPRSAIRSQRRKTSWNTGPASGATGNELVITGTGKTLFPAGAAVLVEGVTLVRTRGEMLFLLTTSTATPGGFHGAVGLAVVTDQAFAAGVASIPGPIGEDDWDGWFYHRFFSVLGAGPIDSGVAADIDQVNGTTASLRIEVDSKAMRKLSVGQTLVAVLETVEVGTASMSIFFNCRMLVKLS